MGIIEALKNKNYDLRLKNHNRWLAWDDISMEWEIYELKKGQTFGTLILSTKDEELAINCLLEN